MYRLITIMLVFLFIIAITLFGLSEVPPLWE